MPLYGPDITIDDSAYIHKSALIYGAVTIGANSSVWPHVVMRAEMFEICIGARTNIQDFVMVHVGGASPTVIGDDCSITHHVTLHGCTVGDQCLIGINATLMDGSVIGKNSIVAGHSIVTENSVFPDNVVIAGAPAKIIAERDCGDANRFNAHFYAQNARNYQKQIYRLDPDQLMADFQKTRD